jgi:endonuclease/exonuclease/phosphatase (EEP) superfamily protein YafD
MYKPGGTMSSALGNTVSRVITTGTDDLGRWSYMKLSGKDGKVLTIITAYQVCRKNTTAVNNDSCTAHSQQQSLLIQQNKANPSPVKHFRLDLEKFMQQCHSQQELLLLFGDFNEVFGPDSAGLAKMARKFDLINVMHQTHPVPDPATYARGKTRIDYILASEPVFQAVNACGYEPFNKHFLSDHRGYFVDFDSHKLFGNELQRLASQPFRDVRGKDTTSVTQYVEAKDHYLNAHNFYRRTDLLSPTHRTQSCSG